MKKLILCSAVGVALALSFGFVTATENPETVNVVSNTAANAAVKTVDEYIQSTYNKIDFSKGKKVDFDVFKTAMYGYLNLKNEGSLAADKDILTICDMSQSSVERRMWVIDLKANKVLINDYVAHGQGSGDEFARAFSNTSNSHQTSLGFYVTDETYVGKHGTSLRLKGMDKGYNSAAYERAVVVHGADYVSEDFIAGQKRLGRSWGCPAVSNKIAANMINTIKEGTCLFVYYPQKDYMQTAYWVNKKVETYPGCNGSQIAANMNTPKDTVIIYENSVVNTLR